MPAPSKRDQLWEHVVRLERFSSFDLVKAGFSITMVRKYLAQWQDEDRVHLSHKGEDGYLNYVLAGCDPAPEEPGDEAPSAEGNMWRTMRGLRMFTATDLATHSTAGDIEVSLDKARDYIRVLNAAGYLKVRRKAAPGARQALYQLVEDTGPRAPRITRVQGVLDPNLRAFTPADGRVPGGAS